MPLLKWAQTYSYFILILLAWGLWGFFGKYALKFISPVSLILYETIGAIIIQLIVVGYLIYSKTQLDANTTGISIAIISGVISTIGVILFYFTLSKVRASILVPLTALYPVVTVILSLIFLKEKVTLM